MAAPRGAIYHPGTIWAESIERVKNSADSGKGDQSDSYLFVVGPRQSGKSTLLNRILYPDKSETPKPGTSFECSYARANNARPDKKDIVHIWELCGPKELTEAAVEGDRLFLSAPQVATATVLIVVDVSEPDALQQARSWLDRVHSRCNALYGRMRAEGSRGGDKLLERARARFTDVEGKENEESGKVRHTGVAVVVVGTKLDLVGRGEGRRMRDLNRAFRALAHANGAGLALLGGMGGQDAMRMQAGDEFSSHLRKNLEAFRSYFKTLMFGGLRNKRDERAAQACQTGADKPAFVPGGCDSTAKIRSEGAPQPSPPTDPERLLAECEEDLGRSLGGAQASQASQAKGAAAQEEAGPGGKPTLGQYPEPELDGIIDDLMGKFSEVQRDKERAKQQQEARRKAQQQARAAAAAAAAAGGGGGPGGKGEGSKGGSGMGSREASGAVR